MLRQSAGWFGWAGLVFAIALLGWVLLLVSGQSPGMQLLLLVALLAAGGWLFARLFRLVAKQVLWRLRHRLIVTYLFIAVAPVVLLSLLATAAGYFILLQVAMNVVTTELEHRQRELARLAELIALQPPSVRAGRLPTMIAPYFTERYPEINAVLVEGSQISVFPPVAGPSLVPGVSAETGAAQGLLRRGESVFLWAYQPLPDGGVHLIAPLNHPMLDSLAPELGPVDIASTLAARPKNRPLPAGVNSWDRPLAWVAALSANRWDAPTEPAEPFIIVLETRLFTAFASVFGREADIGQDVVQASLIAGLVTFLLVGVVCWIVGVKMTQTITGAVHHLHEGTQRVMEGRLSLRIPIEGDDQLAEVGSSFNRMTANLEHLVAVEKEKERMHGDLEIAREVQRQLYPRMHPRSAHLRVAAYCHPAKMVSGDYFDYESAGPGRVALAVGDVSGKGISAALLMASLQSSLRTQLQDAAVAFSSAAIVTRTNAHLCASSTPDKFATFCLGLYDEATHTMVYTNAGHLPPALIRRGRAQRLEVSGTIVGSFPWATYEESLLMLEPGDLIVWFTDGISELENAFGEMFGEDQLVDLVMKNAHHSEDRIVELILDAARQWSGSDEVQDDLTLLLVRRV